MDLSGMFDEMEKRLVDNIITDEYVAYMIMFHDGSHAMGLSNNVARLAMRAQELGDEMGLRVIALVSETTIYAIDWDNEESGPGGV